MVPGAPAAGKVLVLRGEDRPFVVTARRPKHKQQRHVRKYAEGELGEDKSFYFRGPENALNLRAQNLATFLQLAAGIDDNTCFITFAKVPIRGGSAMPSKTRTTEAAGVEKAAPSANDSRARIKELVERRYTAPAKY